MSDDSATLRRQFKQLQEQKHRQLAQRQCSANVSPSKNNSSDSGSDIQASSFGVLDDMDLKAKIVKYFAVFFLAV